MPARGGGRLSDPDAVSIYANLIDNALAACRAGETVHVNGIVRQGVAVLEVRNPAHEGEALPSAFRRPLQPGRRRGIGLASVQRTAGRYGGALTLRTEGGSVVARVVLPVAPE